MENVAQVERHLDHNMLVIEEKPIVKEGVKLDTALDFEREFKKLSSSWFIPFIAVILVAFAFMMLISSPNWNTFSHVRNTRHVVFWLMVGAVFLIPLSKIKKSDRGYVHVLKVPLEIVALGTIIAWISISGQYDHLVYFLVLLFMALCLLGYLVTYVKDIFCQGESLRRRNLLFGRIYHKYLKVDLKRSQGLKVFVAIFIQPFVVGLIVLIAILLENRIHPLLLLIVLVITYMLWLSVHIRYKVSKVQEDYLKLYEMIHHLAAGNLEVGGVEDLGVFNELKGELAHIQEGVAKAVKRAIASERMKGELITNVSHDLKTPLTSIITYVDLLQVDDLDDEKKHQYLNSLVVKTDRLKTLVEDLFEVSKATTGNIKMDLMEIDVITLMKQTLLGLEDRIVESGLILREGYPKAPVKLMLDGGRMHRVFENLIINMVKYAMPGTRAYIDIIEGEGRVEIILRNISAHELHIDMNDLAERFVRGDAARNTEGSGLGLAIAKSFIELQGGTFTIAVDGDLFKVIMTFGESTATLRYRGN